MKQDLEYNQLYKIILVGDAGVGKTHLLNKYVKNSLPKNPVPTIGVEFATKTVTLNNNQKVKAQIWDTAGQQQYRSITMAHYRRACGALIVYDVTKQRSFNNVKKWLDNIKDQADRDVVIMLVGNKIDLQSQRAVKREQGQAFARQVEILFEETSAKQQSMQKLDTIFKKLLEQINLTKKQSAELENASIKLNSNQQKQNSCEC